MDWTALLLTATVKATVIFAAALLIAFALLRASAAARYFVWSAALATALALPVISICVRPWKVPVDAASGQISNIVSAVGAIRMDAMPSKLPFSWIVPVWLCGMALVFARIAAGHIRMAFWVRRTKKLRDPEWIALLADASSRTGLRRSVNLRRSEDTDTPLSYGYLRPVVVLPDECTEWSLERRRVVLLHELVHAQRLDSLNNLIAHLCCAAYWFHPLAWWAWACFRMEQERSCDDAVVTAGTLRSVYAEHLVSLASSLTSAHRCRPVALPMAGKRDFEQRICALLDPLTNRRAPSGRLCCTVVIAMLAVAVPFAALRAQDSRSLSALSGSVLDASGAGVPHAAIVLRSSDGTHQEISASGEDGSFNLSRVAAGQYTIEVKARGFAAYQQSGVVLNTGVGEHLDVKLALGAVTETVDVLGKTQRPGITPPPRRIPVGGNVQATKLVYSAKPAYPAAAESAGTEGTVVLRAVISTEGNLLGLSVMNTFIDPALARAALDAVQQWRYEPTLLNGLPVEVTTTIAVNFLLQR